MTTSARRPDIDWLRIGATWLLFVFHGAKVFDPAPFFHIRNAETSMSMLVGAGFIGLWHMPLFFLLAGWSLVAPLRARGVAGFLRERVARLLVPLAAGIVCLGPIMKYIELRGGLDLSATGLRVAPALQESFRQVIPQGLGIAPPFDEGFFEFVPGFFTSLERFTWGHLWFLAYLFVFSVAWLPLILALLRRPSPTRVAPVWLYAPLVPLVLVQLVLRPIWPGVQNLYDDWANVGYYSTFFLAGFLLAWAPAFQAALAAEWRRALAVAGATTLVLLLVVLGVIPRPAVALAGSAVAGWCWVLALLGAAHEFIARPAPDTLIESALPIYILHQPALIIVGWFLVLPLPLSVWPKFFLLVTLSMALTIAVYALLVRPFALPRFLLGMKTPQRTASNVAVGRAATTALLVAGLLLIPCRARAATPEGLWYAEGGAAQVEIARCGQALCGRVTWLRSPLDEEGCTLRDLHNPDPTLRTRPVLGIEVLRGLRPADAGVWTDGTIYDPGSGRTYRCELRLDDDGRLRLRGWVGVSWLGRTTRWVRVGRENLSCH